VRLKMHQNPNSFDPDTTGEVPDPLVGWGGGTPSPSPFFVPLDTICASYLKKMNHGLLAINVY